jgi:hypothetical protein
MAAKAVCQITSRGVMTNGKLPERATGRRKQEQRWQLEVDLKSSLFKAMLSVGGGAILPVLVLASYSSFLNLSSLSTSI